MACYLLDKYGALVDGWPRHDGPNSKRKPIIEACRPNDLELVGKMLHYDVNTAGAMTAAASDGYLAIVYLLIDYGASVNAGSPSPIVYAVELKHTAMCRLLHEHGARWNTTGTSGEAVSRAKGQKLDSMLELLR